MRIRLLPHRAELVEADPERLTCRCGHRAATVGEWSRHVENQGALRGTVIILWMIVLGLAMGLAF